MRCSPQPDARLNLALGLFAGLQILDVCASLVFSSIGLLEGNPLVKGLMEATGSELGGLLAAKLVAAAVGLYCWRCGRRRLLERANALYAGVVIWNLAAIAFRAARVDAALLR